MKQKVYWAEIKPALEAAKKKEKKLGVKVEKASHSHGSSHH